jgi:hypothetical protein
MYSAFLVAKGNVTPEQSLSGMPCMYGRLLLQYNARVAEGRSAASEESETSKPTV